MASRLDDERRVLITGAAGLLGLCTAHHMLGSGWLVTPLPREVLDIADEYNVSRAVHKYRPEIIINCAAITDVDRCETEPELAERVNVDGPRFLARAARETGADIVHISTDYVFDGDRQDLYSESDEPNPRSEYAKTKLAGEIAVRAETDRSYVIRSSWIFGRGGKNYGSRVIEYARRGQPLKAVTDQTSIPTYAPDLAERILEIIDKRRYGLYHVTNSGITTWYEFAQLALELAGLTSIQIEPVTRAALGQRAERPRNSAMRCTATESLGLPPLRHWRDAVGAFVREFEDSTSPSAG